VGVALRIASCCATSCCLVDTGWSARSVLLIAGGRSTVWSCVGMLELTPGSESPATGAANARVLPWMAPPVNVA
jgi:hypothetical protein